MKKNNWLSYFLYSAILIGYITISNKMLLFLNEQRARTYDNFPYMTWSTIIFILLGALIGLEKFILEVRKEGPWKVNLPKVILLGIPSLYFTFGWTLYYFPVKFLYQTLAYPIQFFLLGNFKLLPVFQMIFGYVIVTSFIKVDDSNTIV